MSLFKWSTPERKRAGRILPIIPNEIYFHIFEHVAPPTKRPTPEQLRTFANLACVCRFFANSCLPRIFEFVEFSGAVFRDDTPTRHKTSHGTTLCTQIAAKQPLALALAKTVRKCQFTDWGRDSEDIGSWAVRLFSSKCIAAMAHMTNIRVLGFYKSCVDLNHWRAISNLPALEELWFDGCEFLSTHGRFESEKMDKVSRLCMAYCVCPLRVVAVIDFRCLRTLSVDPALFDLRLGLESASTLVELRLSGTETFGATQDEHATWLCGVLMQAPQSLEVLELSLKVFSGLGIFQKIFSDPLWKNLSLLRSLKLWISCLDAFEPKDVFTSALEGVSLLTNLQSFILQDLARLVISAAEIECILHGKLGPASKLKYVDIYGNVLRLVDGEWTRCLT